MHIQISLVSLAGDCSESICMPEYCSATGQDQTGFETASSASLRALRDRPLSVVVAGILPAVRPGILALKIHGKFRVPFVPACQP